VKIRRREGAALNAELKLHVIIIKTERLGKIIPQVLTGAACFQPPPMAAFPVAHVKFPRHDVGGGTHAAPSKGLSLWSNHS
jgi:hypothetical protein